LPTSRIRKKPRLLLVEDNEDVRQLYTERMRQSGWFVEAVGDGGQAVVVAAAFEPDAIVMDLAMPTVNGIEAARRLKRDLRTRHIPIVALSDNPSMADRAIGAGCEVFVSKPCTPRALLGTLMDLLGRVAPER
jgi:CheY-like chemotaxis protein